MNPGGAPKSALTPTQWLICFIASIGFAFDIYELLMGPLVFPPAIEELTGARRGSPEFQVWVGRLFYIPAFAGGLFGLLGGYLTDRLGRRRVLTWSILIYAFGAFAAGFSTNIQMLLFFRCLVFIGVCVEFVAAVAWLAELFPDPKRREKVLGYTQAFSSVGGLLVAVANGLCVKYALSFPGVGLPDWLNLFGGEIKDPHAPWRYTLMTGLIPAIPLIFIRPFLPESPAWAKKRAEGTLRRPSFAALFAPELRQTTIVTALMFACAYGAAFGAIQQIPQIVPGLPEVRAQVKARLESDEVKQKVEKRLADPEVQAKLGGMTDEAEKKNFLATERARIERPEAARIQQGVASSVTKVQEIGGLIGRFTLAALAVYIVSRRKLLRLFQVPGLIVMPVVFAYCAVTGLNLLYAGIFLAGFLTVAQFSFWGNYLPRVYPVHLRGTGESFAANIGGRLIGTSFAWVTATLATTTEITRAPTKLAYTAAAVAFGVYLVGFLLSFALPEPKHEELPE